MDVLQKGVPLVLRLRKTLRRSTALETGSKAPTVATAHPLGLEGRQKSWRLACYHKEEGVKMIWIALPLWIIAFSLLRIIDFKKRSFRMVDIDRAKVYGEHLGKKLQ